MIAVHTHILPGIDDGAKTPSIGGDLLRLDFEQGVKEVVFTPHYYGKKRPWEEFLRLRESSFEQIKEFVPAGMKTRLGAEVFMSGINDPSNEGLCALAIEGTKYVLMEFPFFGKWQRRLYERIVEFVEETGYRPIVAHVERYEEVLKNPSVVSELIRIGCLIQVNTSAFLEKGAKNFAYALLKKDMVHCFGTDTHDLLYRKPNYTDAALSVKEAGCEKQWSRVLERMERLLEGESISVEGKPLKKVFGRYF